jgi:protein SCO1/2
VWDNFGMFMTRNARRALAATVAIIAVGVGVLVAALQDPAPPQLGAGTWLPAPRIAPDIELVDQLDRPAQLSALTGAPSLVFFGFSNCPDVCPTTLALLATLRQQTQLKPLRVVMITVDPQRDRPLQMRRYLAGFDPEFIGLTGTPAALESVAAAYSALAARQDMPGGDYTMDHSATVYLLDRRARLVAVFTPPLSLEKMRADLDALRDRLG